MADWDQIFPNAVAIDDAPSNWPDGVRVFPRMGRRCWDSLDGLVSTLTAPHCERELSLPDGKRVFLR